MSEVAHCTNDQKITVQGPDSAIYKGQLRHRRFLPASHEFTYHATQFFINLDQLPTLFNQTRLWSVDRSNIGAFKRSDFLGDPSQPLKKAVLQRLSELLACPYDGVAHASVCVLANLRVWGACFNPVTFYYCYLSSSEQPDYIVAEVNNTPWNERHSYLVPYDNGKAHHQFKKAFHVSPFNPLDMDYHWHSTSPGEQLAVHMENHRSGEKHMDATLTLQRYEWSALALNQVLWRAPWLSVKIPLSIYWQALKLWLKKVPLHDHQVAPPIDTNVDLNNQPTDVPKSNVLKTDAPKINASKSHDAKASDA